MDFRINTKEKNLFLILSTISLILMMVVTTLLWWLISPRLHEISSVLAGLSLTALRVFFLILLVGTVVVLLISYTEYNLLVARFAIGAYIKILFPITLLLGRLLGISKEKIRESFVCVNNSFINALKKKFKSSNLLILLPHCLQNIECDIRITTDINKCRKCGKCNIAELCAISDRYKVKMAIATGGTLARKIIIDNKPKFIIAVACDRDLVEGLREVFPIPVYGVLNIRPEGPCVNTQVATKKIQQALDALILNEQKER
ncbi:MAG: DUF116 domain-containing protein [Candidatus Cloacimonetes bacterium]|nr:DUF116 domain-containing protein [Candidatus Cloacimonadota bacterium]